MKNIDLNEVIDEVLSLNSMEIMTLSENILLEYYRVLMEDDDLSNVNIGEYEEAKGLIETEVQVRGL